MDSIATVIDKIPSRAGASRAKGLMSVETATDEVPPAKDASAKDPPAKDAPAKDAPARDAPARDAPAKDAGGGAPVQARPAAPEEPRDEDPLQGAFPLPDEEYSLVGQLVAGRYRVTKKLGEGGMGIVYLAVHETIEKPVALKVLLHEYARKEVLKARFLREAKAAARIAHENIVDIHDFGETPDGSVFFAMEFLEGKDLSRAVRTEGAFPWERAKPILLQLCRALMAAHAKGIIHRDLKPENVRLVKREYQNDFVKLLDFGIAKMGGVTDDERRLTKTGMIFGTPEYMSPEQARGEKPDHRVDIYATGVIMYEMLTGQVPFRAETFMGILTKHLFEKPVPPSEVNPDAAIPPELEAIVLKAMAKKREDRFQSMREMAAAIAACRVSPTDDAREETTDSGSVEEAYIGRSTGVGMEEESDSLPPVERTTGVGHGTDAGHGTDVGDGIDVGVEDRPVAPVEPPAWRRREVQIGLGLVLAVVTAVLVYLTVRGTARPVDPREDPGRGGVPSGVLRDAGASPDAPAGATVRISVESTPPGASIYKGVPAPGKQPIGRTPFTVEAPREPGTLLLTLRLAGYRDAQGTVSLSQDGKLSVALEASSETPVSHGAEPRPDAAPLTKKPPFGKRHDARVRRPPPPGPDPLGEVPGIKNPFKTKSKIR